MRPYLGLGYLGRWAWTVSETVQMCKSRRILRWLELVPASAAPLMTVTLRVIDLYLELMDMNGGEL